jgi:hypothetical protein
MNVLKIVLEKLVKDRVEKIRSGKARAMLTNLVSNLAARHINGSY